MDENGVPRRSQKISLLYGNFLGDLEQGVFFGTSVSSIDLDGDDVPDLAVGARGDDGGSQGALTGAVWILFMNRNGTVKKHQKISQTEGNLNVNLDALGLFGSSVDWISDFDGDGIPDLAVGSPLSGKIWVLMMHRNGTVKNYQTIIDEDSGILHSSGQFTSRFGQSVKWIGDIDGDGVIDIAVGAPRYTNSRGELYPESLTI